MSPKSKYGVCCLCERETDLTFHHLIPRMVHSRKHFKKHFTKEELNTGIDICQQCHSIIHDSYTEMELAKKYYTLDALITDPFLANQFAWVSKQKIKA